MADTDPRLAARPVVQGFAVEMERQLRENDHKGGWEGCDIDWLLRRLREETDELDEAIHRGHPKAAVWEEAADVANFALMVADNCGPGLASAALPPCDHAAELGRLRGALGDLLWWHEWMQREDRFTADIADTDEEAERRHVLWQTFLDHVATAEWLRAALEPR